MEKKKKKEKKKKNRRVEWKGVYKERRKGRKAIVYRYIEYGWMDNSVDQDTA